MEPPTDNGTFKPQKRTQGLPESRKRGRGKTGLKAPSAVQTTQGPHATPYPRTPNFSTMQQQYYNSPHPSMMNMFMSPMNHISPNPYNAAHFQPFTGPPPISPQLYYTAYPAAATVQPPFNLPPPPPPPPLSVPISERPSTFLQPQAGLRTQPSPVKDMVMSPNADPGFKAQGSIEKQLLILQQDLAILQCIQAELLNAELMNKQQMSHQPSPASQLGDHVSLAVDVRKGEIGSHIHSLAPVSQITASSIPRSLTSKAGDMNCGELQSAANKNIAQGEKESPLSLASTNIQTPQILNTVSSPPTIATPADIRLPARRDSGSKSSVTPAPLGNIAKAKVAKVKPLPASLPARPVIAEQPESRAARTPFLLPSKPDLGVKVTDKSSGTGTSSSGVAKIQLKGRTPSLETSSKAELKAAEARQNQPMISTLAEASHSAETTTKTQEPMKTQELERSESVDQAINVAAVEHSPAETDSPLPIVEEASTMAEADNPPLPTGPDQAVKSLSKKGRKKARARERKRELQKELELEAALAATTKESAQAGGEIAMTDSTPVAAKVETNRNSEDQTSTVAAQPAAIVHQEPFLPAAAAPQQLNDKNQSQEDLESRLKQLIEVKNKLARRVSAMESNAPGNRNQPQAMSRAGEKVKSKHSTTSLSGPSVGTSLPHLLDTTKASADALQNLPPREDEDAHLSPTSEAVTGEEMEVEEKSALISLSLAQNRASEVELGHVGEEVTVMRRQRSSSIVVIDDEPEAGEIVSRSRDSSVIIEDSDLFMRKKRQKVEADDESQASRYGRAEQIGRERPLVANPTLPFPPAFEKAPLPSFANGISRLGPPTGPTAELTKIGGQGTKKNSPVGTRSPAARAGLIQEQASKTQQQRAAPYPYPMQTTQGRMGQMYQPRDVSRNVYNGNVSSVSPLVPGNPRNSMTSSHGGYNPYSPAYPSQQPSSAPMVLLPPQHPPNISGGQFSTPTRFDDSRPPSVVGLPGGPHGRVNGRAPSGMLPYARPSGPQLQPYPHLGHPVPLHTPSYAPAFTLNGGHPPPPPAQYSNYPRYPVVQEPRGVIGDHRGAYSTASRPGPSLPPRTPLLDPRIPQGPKRRLP